MALARTAWLMAGVLPVPPPAHQSAKVLLRGLHFMDLRTAPAPLRLAFEAWTAVLGTGLVALILL